MTPEFSAKLEAKLSEYREFAAARRIASCRLVHYCGVDVPNAIDVPLNQIESQITGCLCEGLYVGWFENDERLYLCIQEPDCPAPPREKVIAEEAIADVSAILRKAGFGGEA
jgi:hypothetical protein